MLSGDKLLTAQVPASRDTALTRALALLLLLLAGGAVYGLVSLGAG